MEFFRFRKDIPFMRHVLVLNIISLITFAAAVYFLATRGLHLSIEFEGGTLVEVQYSQPADIGKARTVVDGMGFGEVQVQNFGTSRDVLIRLPRVPTSSRPKCLAACLPSCARPRPGTVGTKQYTTPQGEQVSRPSCTAADGRSR
jgi:preprotein translocase subunit SecF